MSPSTAPCAVGYRASDNLLHDTVDTLQNQSEATMNVTRTPGMQQVYEDDEHAPNQEEESRLMDYTIDDEGHRIPAPPHRRREDLIACYQARKFKHNGLAWSTIRKTREAARQAEGAFQLREHQRTTASDRPKPYIRRSPAFTEPLFPPLPLYGPPNLVRSLQILVLRMISFCLTLGFLLVIILGALATSFIPNLFKDLAQRVLLRDPDRGRKFITEERRRREEHKHSGIAVTDDVAYYAGLLDIRVEQYTCQTLDGFTLHLLRLYDQRPMTPSQDKRYPVLLLHGLLQSAGAFCVNDEDSLAFYLCRQGFDVWLGNNRCWFKPERKVKQHTKRSADLRIDAVLSYGDPRMWAWNIRQLGGLDLPAMIQTVCDHTDRDRIGFVGHSQGTTQTFCSLSRDQYPEIGLKMDCFCALAPAVYAGALIDKLQFKFMRVLGSKGFRIFFGINAFIPIMMTFQRILPGSWYGQVGYLVFNFLFGWSDSLWDRRLKSRFFQFSPVFVSSESMRWWMRDFALFRSILEDTEEVWYRKETFPPLAFWTCGQDQLVNGQKFTERIVQREGEVTIVHRECLEEYAHLDVLWAMDAIDRVGVKVKEILWACATERSGFVVPLGCDHIPSFPDPRGGRTTVLKEVTTGRLPASRD